MTDHNALITDRFAEPLPDTGLTEAQQLQSAGPASSWVGRYATSDVALTPNQAWGQDDTENSKQVSVQRVYGVPGEVGLVAVSNQVESDHINEEHADDAATSDEDSAPPVDAGDNPGGPPKTPRVGRGFASGEPEDHGSEPEEAMAASAAEIMRSPAQVAAIDSVIDYEAAARTLGRRPTTPDLAIKAAFDTLGHPAGVTTSDVGYRLGLDHEVMRTALPGMAALGLVSEVGLVRPTGGLGRPAALYRPEQGLGDFAKNYNNLRLDILREQLPETHREQGSREFEWQILDTVAIAHRVELGGKARLSLNALAERLDMHPEAVRYYGFNGFVAARPGLSALVDYKLKTEIQTRRAQRTNEA